MSSLGTRLYGSPCQALNLLVMDKNLLSKGGSSDPLVKFNCVHSKATSTTKMKQLSPEWKESFVLAADAPDGFLEVVMEDYDKISGNDFMGLVKIPLIQLLDRSITRRWYRLGNKKVHLTAPPACLPRLRAHMI